MKVIKIADFSKEAASKTKGIVLRDLIEKEIGKTEDITIDFEGINRIASPFFNNSFGALVLKYGVEKIRSVRVSNLSPIGRQTYELSLENAEMISDDSKLANEMNTIINVTPKQTKE